uniref:uncharacterized protein LOC120342997 n=1 Tax=Styela clava TaxID=7725 RepID=UPI00193A8D59|nr:uncharacterized protein LOC120342997 [Styela clava]XP_039267993.1 uncharacterized protein LOC120342997 [Styela clava]
MAEGGSQPPVINVQLPAITVNYQEGTRFAGDNVGQKTKIQAAEIGQIVVPTEGSNVQTPTHPSHHGVTDNLGKMNLTEGTHFVIFENIRRLINKSKFVDALITLQDIPPSQEQQFMMSECYCQLGRPNEALRCIEKLQSEMTSLARPSVDDVIKTVDNYISDSSHIRALILLTCCAKLYKFDSNPNNLVFEIRHCSLKCWKVIKALVNEGDRMKAIATDVGLKIITDMLKELRSVSGADKNTGVDMEARCLTNVGASYDEVGKYEEAIGFHNEGLDLMNQTFGLNAAKYVVFGTLLYNMGSAQSGLGDYSKAESFYLQSLDAYKKVEDWPSDKMKREIIESTKNNLKILRNRKKK